MDEDLLNAEPDGRREDNADASRRKDILHAVRTVRDEPPLRVSAQNPDLRAGKVDLFHVISIDLAELLADWVAGSRVLLRLRADDKLFECLKAALIGSVQGAEEQSSFIRERMTRARSLGGKAVWTDHFVERHSPLMLPCAATLTFDSQSVARTQPIDSNGDSELHHVKFLSHHLQAFRDGTICYTLRTEFDDPKANHDIVEPPIASEIIRRLSALDDVVEQNFKHVLAEFLRSDATRARLRESMNVAGLDGVEFLPSPQIEQLDVRRKATSHTVIFVECFYDGDAIAELYRDHSYRGERDKDALVGLHTVLTSSTLPGILNSATWYERYNSRYVRSLSRKEIGYRDDEIYLTDRKATVAVNPKFWDSKDPLSYYKHDIVLAVQYNNSRLTYFGSVLRYYQSHPDVRGFDKMDPAAGLARVVDGQAIVLLIEESLDLTLLIDHGFTRLFVRRLHDELGFQEAIGFIRQRVDDAARIVSLRSTVLAAELTSKESLEAAHENNRLQRTIRRLALLAIAVALAIAGVSWAINIWGKDSPQPVRLDGRYCLDAAGARPSVLVLCTDPPADSSPAGTGG